MNSDSRLKPSIEKYFTRSSSGSAALVLDRKNPSKRLRSPENGNSHSEPSNKRLHGPSPPRNEINHTNAILPYGDDGRRDDNDWIGPYGI